jgi:hypothetical protein
VTGASEVAVFVEMVMNSYLANTIDRSHAEWCVPITAHAQLIRAVSLSDAASSVATCKRCGTIVGELLVSDGLRVWVGSFPARTVIPRKVLGRLLGRRASDSVGRYAFVLGRVDTPSRLLVHCPRDGSTMIETAALSARSPIRVTPTTLS